MVSDLTPALITALLFFVLLSAAFWFLNGARFSSVRRAFINELPLLITVSLVGLIFYAVAAFIYKVAAGVFYLLELLINKI